MEYQNSGPSGTLNCLCNYMGHTNTFTLIIITNRKKIFGKQTKTNKLIWPQGPLLESPNNFSGPESYFRGHGLS